MSSEPSVWHPLGKAVVPVIMSEKKTNRTSSGGTVTQQPVRYGGNRVLTTKQMNDVAQEMLDWAQRSRNPNGRKFSEAFIPQVDAVVGIWDDGVPPGDALPILEEFLKMLRTPYGGGHVTMPVRRNWVESVLDFVYTLVSDDESQELLREQFEQA